jgi:hypothetical protein
LLTAGGALVARRRTPRDPIDPVEAELQAMIAEELRRRAETETSPHDPALRP